MKVSTKVFILSGLLLGLFSLNMVAHADTTNQPQNNNQGNDNDISVTDSNFISYDDNYGFSHFTRYNLEHMQDGNNTDQQNPIGNFSQNNIKDLASAVDTRSGVKGQPLNVWDSWPLQDANGHEVTYHGYHLVFALAGNPNEDYTLTSGQTIQDSRIYLFYQKISQQRQGINSWHSAGPVFNSSIEGANKNNSILEGQLAQWSGQTVLTSKDKIRLFYTTFNGSKNNDWQALATAQLSISDNKNGVKINHSMNKDHKVIATADGKMYQTLSQSKDDKYDENVFRDVHYFVYKNKKYIAFSANSSSKTGPQGLSAIYNAAYLGGDVKFQQSQQRLILPTVNNPWHFPGIDYNAVIGVAELNNNYTVKKFKKPILGFNTITDEFERPDLFKHNNKWYLFGVTRGYKLATPNVKSTNSYLIGFIADSPFGPYKPLNKNGLVVRNTRSWNSRKYTYSFYVLNSKHGNDMVMTSYMTNSKISSGHQTFAPSMVLTLKGDSAIVHKKVLNQGQLVK